MLDTHCDLCLVKMGQERIFVMISANCPSVLVYAKSITFLLCQYLITWCLTSMCFVRLFVTKLVAMVMQAWLSSRKRTGSSIWMPNSLRKERSQITALHAPTIVRCWSSVKLLPNFLQAGSFYWSLWQNMPLDAEHCRLRHLRCIRRADILRFIRII